MQHPLPALLEGRCCALSLQCLLFEDGTSESSQSKVGRLMPSKSSSSCPKWAKRFARMHDACGRAVCEVMARKRGQSLIGYNGGDAMPHAEIDSICCLINFPPN